MFDIEKLKAWLTGDFGEPKVEFLQHGDGRWRWSLKSANGDTVCVGAVGFSSRGTAKRSARRARKLLTKAVID